MSLATNDVASSVSAEVARQFLEALQEGRVIDALDALAPDAVVQELPDRERRGIRSIAAALLRYRTPGLVDILEVHPSDQGATARLRTTSGTDGRARVYRATFGIADHRIRSIRLSAA